MQSRIFKKFLISIVGFLIIIVGINIVINFQIKKIKNVISERNSLITNNSSKFSESIEIKNTEIKIKSLEKQLGIEIAELNKVLNEKIKKPSFSQISGIFQETARKYSSRVILSQKNNGQINGEWNGSIDGFQEILGVLKESNFSIKFDKITIEPIVINQSENVSNSQLNKQTKQSIENFLIEFEISII